MSFVIRSGTGRGLLACTRLEADSPNSSVSLLVGMEDSRA